MALELVNELLADFGILTFPAGNTGAQMGGWFREETFAQGVRSGVATGSEGWGPFASGIRGRSVVAAMLSSVIGSQNPAGATADTAAKSAMEMIETGLVPRLRPDTVPRLRPDTINVRTSAPSRL